MSTHKRTHLPSTCTLICWTGSPSMRLICFNGPSDQTTIYFLQYCTNAFNSSGGVTCDLPDVYLSSAMRSVTCDLQKFRQVWRNFNLHQQLYSSRYMPVYVPESTYTSTRERNTMYVTPVNTCVARVHWVQKRLGVADGLTLLVLWTVNSQLFSLYM